MSTTIKRVALVAVAALGLGVLSVAPSTAAINADTLTLSAATASQTTAETATATSAVATLSFLGTTDVDSVSVTASLVSAPAGATALPFLSLSETSSASVDSKTVTVKPVGSVTASNVAAVVYAKGAPAVAKFKVYLGTDSLTAPAKAGTYVVKLTPAAVSGSLQAATAQTLTITVTEAPALDTVITTATAIISAGYTDSKTADQVVTGSKTVAASAGTYTSAIANIKVTPKNAAGTVVGTTSTVGNNGESLTAIITGPGSLGSGAWGGTTANNARGRAISVKAGDFIYVYPDGSSGTSTITIQSALGVVLATKTVTFFGAPASIVTTAQATVLNPNAANGASTAGDDTTRPLKVVVKDAAGVAVSNLATTDLYVTADTTTIVSNSYSNSKCVYDVDTAAYYCSLDALVAGKTKVTVGTKSSATDTTVGALTGNSVEVRVGTKVAADVKVSTDKSTYAPGEKATITVELFDADGNVVADGAYNSIFATGGIVSDFVLGSGSDTLTATTVKKVDNTAVIAGKKTYTVYMPQNSGTITFTYKTGGTAVTGTAPTSETGLAVANQGVTRTFAVQVANPGVDAATDAANEATDAANAATDAALAAADAADAATAAAQDASDAVAALSAEVSKLIASLKAQLTSLTNLVIKIQKKVKA